MSIETDIALERLVEAKGIKLTANDNELVGRCPFADHDVPALVIDPKANTWVCTEGCGDGGVIAWVAKTEGISLTHAEALLRTDFEPTGTIEPVKHSTTSKLPDLIGPNESDTDVLTKVIGFYHQTLLDSPEALEWLRDRGLRDPDVITHFQLGVADRTLGYRLPKKNRKAGKRVRGQIRRLGILRKTGHEHFRGSLVVPVFDDMKNIVNIYGRKLGGSNLRSGTAIETWLNDDDVGIFNPKGFIEGQKLILAGSVLDALTWWSNGFRNASTTMGKPKLPNAVRALLTDRNIRSVSLAMPRDQNTDVIATDLRDLGIEVHRMVLPHKMDANDIARAADDPKAALSGLLRAANWVSPSRRASTAPQADPEPAEPMPEGHQLTITLGDRRWRVRGLDRISSHATLRVNILVSKGEAASFHVDVIELYSARQRKSFLSAAAIELNVEQKVIKRDLGTVLLRLEAVVDDRLREDFAPGDTAAVQMDEASRQAAVAFLRRPDLFEQILRDFEALGVVGEESNKLVAYLAATSRKLDHPLAVIIQSSSAAGKSSLMDAVLKLFPTEDKLSFSAMTGRSLYYLGEQQLSHKVLSIAEEEGASDAAYALKILQSEGRLTIASTGKESKTGRLTTQTFEVAGPVALMLTTTAIDIDEELLSRCIVLGVDEGRDQTRAIHTAQRHRRTLEGLLTRKRTEQVVKLHHDAQRLLRPLHVVIPEVGAIRVCDHALRSRRDHGKLLGLIEAVALLRQFTKPTKELNEGGIRVQYIEADADDIKVATKLAHTSLGHRLDELPPGTHKLLLALHGYVIERADAEGVDPSDHRFTRRELREALAWGNTQIKVHLRRLGDFEYVVIHRGGGGQRVSYELVYSGEGTDGQPFVPGLGCDGTTGSGRGQKPQQSGVGRPLVGGESAGGRRGVSGLESSLEHDSDGSDQ